MAAVAIAHDRIQSHVFLCQKAFIEEIAMMDSLRSRVYLMYTIACHVGRPVSSQYVKNADGLRYDMREAMR